MPFKRFLCGIIFNAFFFLLLLSQYCHISSLQDHLNIVIIKIRIIYVALFIHREHYSLEELFQQKNSRIIK